VHPRTWRPAPLLAAVVAAACVVAGVLGVRVLHRTPTSLRVVKSVNVGGDLADATTGFGYMWTINSHNGVISQLDPADGRIVRSIGVDLPLDSIAAGAGAIWSTTSSDASGYGRLLRIDPKTGHVTAIHYLRGPSAVVAVGDGAVWLLDTQNPKAALHRVDPATGRVIATVSTHTSGDAIAIGGASLWTLDGSGVLTQHDPQTGKALRRVPGLGRNLGAGEKVLTGDATGVWAVRPGLLVRAVGGGRVVRRIPLPPDTLSVFAMDSDNLWLARGAAGLRSQLLRYDRGTGKLTGSLDLGSHQPQALVPSPRGLWVVCGDGIALLVR
jgi:streptogramin lyase